MMRKTFVSELFHRIANAEVNVSWRFRSNIKQKQLRRKNNKKKHYANVMSETIEVISKYKTIDITTYLPIIFARG